MGYISPNFTSQDTRLERPGLNIIARLADGYVRPAV